MVNGHDDDPLSRVVANAPAILDNVATITAPAIAPERGERMRRTRHRHHVWKRCRHKPREWPRCPCAWYFDFTPRGGKRQKFSLDAELGRHVDSMTEAQDHASAIKTAILAGTFLRAADRRQQEQQLRAATPDAITFRQFADVYIERQAKVSGKVTWKNDDGMLNRMSVFSLGTALLGDKTARCNHRG